VKRILVIDDEPDVVDYISTVLGDDGYDVETAFSGPQGLLKAEQALPDLITLDVEMPGMSGIDVLKKLRSNRLLSHIPVVMISGVSKYSDLLACGEIRPAEGYLPKPIDIPNLLKTVERLLQVAA